jgi:colanic acid/amylovoran biosynthesis glycosyltransferase
VSAYNFDYLNRVAGSDVSRRIRVIHAGLDLGPFRPRGGRPAEDELLIVSNLVEKKGHADLLRACALLRERGLKLRCRIVGDGELRGTLEGLSGQLGLKDQVEFLGRVSNDELRELLERATLFVLPAIAAADGDMDGIPMALMEAMAVGVPCLSTRLSGIPELIEDGISGFLVEPSNPGALADRLQQILVEAASLHRVAGNARRKVLAEFDVEATADAVRDAVVSCARRDAELRPS